MLNEILHRLGSDNEIDALEEFFISTQQLINQYPPTFIVGNSRSGTTLVYTYLLNQFKFAFFSNLAKRNPYSPIIHSLKTNDNFKGASYKSNYGIINGDYQPSDGWDIFNRFFPKYDLSEKPKYDEFYKLINIYYYLEKIFDAPIINKNNMNSIRVKELSEIFPESIFIWVKRNLIDTIISNLKGRRENNIEKEHWFGMPSPFFSNKEFSDEIERVIYRVFSVEKFISENIKRHIHIEIGYEDFCKNPLIISSKLKRAYSRYHIDLIHQNFIKNSPIFSIKQYNKDIRDKINQKANKVINNELYFKEFRSMIK